MSYPPKETDTDTVISTALHSKHKLPMPTATTPATLEAHLASTSASASINYRNDAVARGSTGNLLNADPSNQFGASNRPVDYLMGDKLLSHRYLPINKHEYPSAFNTTVSESVSLRSGSTDAQITPYAGAYNYRDRRSLELSSPASSSSSQTPANLASSLSGSYSPSPFAPLLSNSPFESAVRCTLPSPTIFPPTPPPSAWNPFWWSVTLWNGVGGIEWNWCDQLTVNCRRVVITRQPNTLYKR